MGQTEVFLALTQLAVEALAVGRQMAGTPQMGQMRMLINFVGLGEGEDLEIQVEQAGPVAMAAFLVVGEVRGLVAPQLEALAAKGRTAG